MISAVSSKDSALAASDPFRERFQDAGANAPAL